MKRFKVVAGVLSVAMLAGIFAGCSKTTKIDCDKFVKACEKLKLEELDFDESPEDGLEDGCYSYVSEDDVEDYSDDIDYFLSDYGLEEIVSTDDITSVAWAAKVTGAEDAEDIEDPEDLPDLKLEGAFALQVTCEEIDVEEAMEYFDDKLDEMGLDSKDLTKAEYFASEKEGFVRFHVDIAELLKIAQENDDLMDLISETYDEDDFADLCKDLSGDVAISIEINENNIFVIAGGSFNEKTSTLNSFCSAFGASNNPTKVPMNKDICADALDQLIDSLAYFL